MSLYGQYPVNAHVCKYTRTLHMYVYCDVLHIMVCQLTNATIVEYPFSIYKHCMISTLGLVLFACTNFGDLENKTFSAY